MSTRVLFPNLGARNQVATFYGLIWNDQGLVYQFTAPTGFVSYLTADLDKYDTGAAALTAGGHYSFQVPAGFPAGRYLVEVFQRAGLTPVEADDSFANDAFIHWDGTKLTEIADVASVLSEVRTGVPNVAPGAEGGLPVLDAELTVPAAVAALADGLITEDTIADGAITAPKLADQAITGDKLADTAREGIRDTIWQVPMPDSDGPPPENSSIFDNLRFMAARLFNKRRQIEGEETLYKRDGTEPLAVSPTTLSETAASVGRWVDPS